VFAGNNAKEAVFWTAVSAGSISGMIGGESSRSFALTRIGAHTYRSCPSATLGNPLFLIKARMQAYSPALPIGTQHAYRNPYHALSSVVKHEGWMGLTRGVGSAMLRTAMVSEYEWSRMLNGHSCLTIASRGRAFNYHRTIMPNQNWFLMES
jgi:hypothetical protein